MVLIACLIFGWFEIPNDYKQMGKHVAAGAVFVSNFASWRDAGYFDPAADQKPLLHLWSLGKLKSSFTFFGLCYWDLSGSENIYFLTITLLILCVSFLVNVGTVQEHPIAAYYSPLSRFWELMIGGILAYLTLHQPHRLPKKTNWLSIAGMSK